MCYLRFFLVLLCCLSSFFSTAYASIGMVTGSPTGTYIKFGHDLANIVKEKGIELEVKTSKGSLDNIQRMASSENAGLGIVQSDVLELLKTQFGKKERGYIKKLRLIAPLYNEEIHIFARRSISSIKDLDNKRVAVGSTGGGSWMTAKSLFNSANINPKMIQSTKLEAAKSVLNGQLDAMVYVAGKPVSFFESLGELRAQYNFDNVHFLPIQASDFNMTLPYVESSIGQSDYRWVNNETPTLAVKALLVAFDFSRSVNAYHDRRCEQFGSIGDALRSNINFLKRNGHPKWKEVDLNASIGEWQRDFCSWDSVGMVTGSKTGTYIKFGEQIADVASKVGVVVEVKESAGSKENVDRLNSAENAALGIVQSDVISMLKFSSRQQDRANAEQLRLIAPLYKEEIHILANSQFDSLDDLTGKRIGVGKEGSGTRMTAQLISVYSGVKFKAVEISKEAALKSLFRGEIDAMIYVAGKPVKFFTDLTKYKPLFPKTFDKVRFIPIKLGDFKNKEVPYVSSELTRSEYPWMKGSVPTLAVKSLLVSNDFSSQSKKYRNQKKYFDKRCSQLQRIASSIQTNIDVLRLKGHEKWREVDLSLSLDGWKRDQCAWGKARHAMPSNQKGPCDHITNSFQRAQCELEHSN